MEAVHWIFPCGRAALSGKVNETKAAREMAQKEQVAGTDPVYSLMGIERGDEWQNMKS